MEPGGFRRRPPQSERWLSGRRRRSRKSLYPHGYRGFESLSLRHFFCLVSGVAKKHKSIAMTELTRIFAMIALSAGMLLCGGCASSLYIAGQIEDRPAADLPCCNALHLDLELFREIRQGPDDYLLPPWLDRSLNMTALGIDLPFSLVFDTVTLPYQLLNASHAGTEEPAAHTPPDNSR